MSIFNDMQSILLDMGRTEIRASEKLCMQNHGIYQTLGEKVYVQRRKDGNNIYLNLFMMRVADSLFID